MKRSYLLGMYLRAYYDLSTRIYISLPNKVYNASGLQGNELIEESLAPDSIIGFY